MNTTNPDENSVDMVVATPRGRICAGVLMALAFVLAAAYQFWAFPLLQSELGTVAPSAKSLLALKLIFAAFSTVLTLAGIAVAGYGRKILQAGQFPLANAWVLRDTPVKRGSKALQLAWVHIIAGSLIALLSIGLAAYIWIIVDRFAASYTPPPGVTIEQKKVFTGVK